MNGASPISVRYESVRAHDARARAVANTGGKEAAGSLLYSEAFLATAQSAPKKRKAVIGHVTVECYSGLCHRLTSCAFVV
jgi:hypothetical protein